MAQLAMNGGGTPAVELTPIGSPVQAAEPPSSPARSGAGTQKPRTVQPAPKPATPQQPGPSGIQQLQPKRSESGPRQRPTSAGAKTQASRSSTNLEKQKMYQQRANGLPGSTPYFQMGKQVKKADGARESGKASDGKKNYFMIDPFDKKPQSGTKASTHLKPVRNVAFPQYEKLKDKQKVDKAKANIAVGGQTAIAAARLRKGPEESKKQGNGLYKPSPLAMTMSRPYQPFKSRNEEYKVHNRPTSTLSLGGSLASEPTNYDGILASKLMLAGYLLAAPTADVQPFSNKTLLRIEDVLPEENEMQELPRSATAPALTTTTPQSPTPAPSASSSRIEAPDGGVYVVPVPSSQSHHSPEAAPAPTPTPAPTTIPPSRTSTSASSYHLGQLFGEPETEAVLLQERAFSRTTTTTRTSGDIEEAVVVDRATSVSRSLVRAGLGELATQTTPLPSTVSYRSTPILEPLVGAGQLTPEVEDLVQVVEPAVAPAVTAPAAMAPQQGGTPVKNAIIAGSVIHATNIHINYFNNSPGDGNGVSDRRGAREPHKVKLTMEPSPLSSESESDDDRGRSVRTSKPHSRRKKASKLAHAKAAKQEVDKSGKSSKAGKSSVRSEPSQSRGSTSLASQASSSYPLSSRPGTEGTYASGNTQGTSDNESFSESESIATTPTESPETSSAPPAAILEQRQGNPLSPIDEEASTTRSSSYRSETSSTTPPVTAERRPSSGDSAISLSATPELNRKDSGVPRQQVDTPQGSEDDSSEAEDSSDDNGTSVSSASRAAASQQGDDNPTPTPEPSGSGAQSSAKLDGMMESMNRSRSKFRYK